MSSLNLQDELLSSKSQYSDPTTEQALIALLMTNPASWNDVTELRLTFEHFQTEQHQLLYQAAHAIYSVNINSENVINPDIITIRNELQNRHSESKATELFNLAADIITNTSPTNNATAYAMIVIEKYYLHQIDIAYADREPVQIIQALQTEMDSILRPKPTAGQGNFTELANKEVTETQWVIKDLLPVGVSLFAGKPKSGKTYFAMQMALAISNGHSFLGEFEVSKGTVLQLALEDSERRLTIRYQQLGEYPSGHWFTQESQYPRIGQGFETEIQKHLDDNSDCKLVIVDTLANVMPVTDVKGDTYLKDYQTVTSIKNLAALYPQTAFIFLTHQKKGEATNEVDTILGSSALSGGFDNLYFLMKTGRDGKAILSTTGKDVVQETHALKFDKQLTAWQYVGTGEMATMSDTRQQVIKVMQDDNAETKQDIVQLTDLNDESAKKLLRRMKDDGIIEIVGKKSNQYKYALTEEYQKQDDDDSASPVSPMSPTVGDTVNCGSCGKQFQLQQENITLTNGLSFCSFDCYKDWKYSQPKTKSSTGDKRDIGDIVYSCKLDGLCSKKRVLNNLFFIYSHLDDCLTCGACPTESVFSMSPVSPMSPH